MCAGFKSICEDFNLGKILKLSLYIILILSILSINRVMIFNRIENNGNIHLGQHQEYFTEPDYKSKILKNFDCDYSKALLIPSSSNGYYTYKSWPITGMPNILVGEYCLNVIGASEEEINNLSINNKNLADNFKSINIEKLQNSGIRYVLSSNDVMEANQDNKLKIKNLIYKDLSNEMYAKKIFEDKEIEIFELKNFKPYIKVSSNNNVKQEFKASHQATIYILRMEGGHEYFIETLIPKNSAWNIVLLNTNLENKEITIFDELKMITNVQRRENSLNQFIDWSINPKESVKAVIYNRSSITNYPRLLSSIIIVYYFTLAILLGRQYVKKL